MELEKWVVSQTPKVHTMTYRLNSGYMVQREILLEKHESV